MTRINSIQDITTLLVQSNEEERQREVQYRRRFLRSAEVIALTANILNDAATYEDLYDLRPQDALVHASVIAHLRVVLQKQFEDRQSSSITARYAATSKI